MGWSDIGSWRSLREVKKGDEAGNVTEGDVILDRVRNSYVRADGQASYAVVAQVMAALSTSGFTTINLITDTGGPSSGGDQR